MRDTSIAEYRNGGDACITVTDGVQCTRFGDLVDSNFAQYVAECDAADVCNNGDIETYLTSIGSKQYGTNLNEKDSDFDNVDDPVELDERSITVNGASVSLPAPVSEPLDANSDADDWNDGTELANGTDPRNDDTDGDGLQDHLEGDRGRSPIWKDKRVSATTTDFVITECNDGAGPCEMNWWANLKIGTGTGIGSRVCTYVEDVDVGSAPSLNCDYFTDLIVRIDDSTTNILITMDGWEDDDVDDDECNEQSTEFTYANSKTEQRSGISHDCEGDLKFNTPIDVVVD